MGPEWGCVGVCIGPDKENGKGKQEAGNKKDALLSVKPRFRVRGTTASSASAAWYDHREISSVAWV